MSGICPCTMGNSISKALFGLRDVKKLNCDEPEQTAAATVVSRTVQRSNQITNFQESPWLYLVTFQLENGDELELKTKETTYAELLENSAGTLIWKGEDLVSFLCAKGANV